MSDTLQAGIIRILDTKGETVGAGFLVAERLAVTCAHVMRAAGAVPGGEVTLIFHAADEKAQATVPPETWRDPNAEDVAFLRLEKPLPTGLKPVLLGSSGGTSDHSFKTFGFPAAKPTEGMWGYGSIGDRTTERNYDVLQLTSTTEVTRGFSGAPVLDNHTRRIVGMITSITRPDQHGKLTASAFITPTETLRAICAELQLSDICPYRSLDAFTEADAEFFFGRQRVVDRLLARLRQEPRFLAVLGPSGSGKSSVVRAGLIPRLREGNVPGSDRWGMVVARPANNPFVQFAAQGLEGQQLETAVQTWLARRPEYTRLMLSSAPISTAASRNKPQRCWSGWRKAWSISPMS